MRPHPEWIVGEKALSLDVLDAEQAVRAASDEVHVRAVPLELVTVATASLAVSATPGTTASWLAKVGEVTDGGPNQTRTVAV